MVRKPIDPEDAPKRAAILDAALELFAERGFHGTAVPEVAAKAGVGAGTVYRYFDSKEALANALFRRWKRAFGEALLAGHDAEAPSRASFTRIWQRIFEFHRAHPVVLKFLELHHHHSYLDAESIALERQVLEPIRAFVMAAQDQGHLRPMQPELLMALVFGAFVGMVRAAADGFLELDEASLRASEEAVWRAVGTAR